tara:strand:- start:133 stop:1056 length:924 start_codon:yes stop_codon:yes gene_type:complete
LIVSASWRWFCACLFTALFFAFIFFFFIENDYPYIFGFKELVLGGGFVFLSYFFRSLRFSMFLKKSDSRVGVSSIVTVHGALNYFLPVKSGELSFVYLAKRYYGISASSSLSILLVFRFFDFIFVVFSFVLLAFVFGFDSYWLNFEGRGVLFALAFFVVSVLLVLLAARRVDFVRAVCVDIRSLVFSLNMTKCLVFLAATFCIWVSSWAAFYFFALGAGYTMSVQEVVSVSLLLIPLAFVPVQGFANVGTYETAWVLVLASALGAPSALQIAVSTHIQFTISIFAVGCLGLFFLMLDKWRLPRADQG